MKLIEARMLWNWLREHQLILDVEINDASEFLAKEPWITGDDIPEEILPLSPEQALEEIKASICKVYCGRTHKRCKEECGIRDLTPKTANVPIKELIRSIP